MDSKCAFHSYVSFDETIFLFKIESIYEYTGWWDSCVLNPSKFLLPIVFSKGIQSTHQESWDTALACWLMLCLRRTRIEDWRYLTIDPLSDRKWYCIVSVLLRRGAVILYEVDEYVLTRWWSDDWFLKSDNLVCRDIYYAKINIFYGVIKKILK